MFKNPIALLPIFVVVFLTIAIMAPIIMDGLTAVQVQKTEQLRLQLQIKQLDTKSKP